MELPALVRALRKRPTVVIAIAIAATGIAAPAFGQTKPTPLKKVLSMPVSPGSVALLSLHVTELRAQQRIAAAIGDPDPLVRAVAARVVFTRGIAAFLPEIAGRLARETNGHAAYEQTRALSLAGSQYEAEIADAVQRLKHLNPLLSESAQNVSARFARSQSTELFRIPGDYPPALLDAVAKATGCKLQEAARTRAAAGAEVSLRLDGRVSQISVIDTKLKRECAEAVLALFALYAAGVPRPAEEGERRVLMIPLVPEEPECRVNPAAAQSLPESIQGGALTPPQKIRDVRPVYPAGAQTDRKSGIVILEAVISAAGCVSSAKVLRGADPRLDWAALYAVLQWRFTPPVINGKPRPVIMSVTTTFTLN
jgi:TonB family protein